MNTPEPSSNLGKDGANGLFLSESHLQSTVGFGKSQAKLLMTQSQSSLDKVIEALKPRNLRASLMANMQALVEDHVFEEGHSSRTEMDKSLAEICDRNKSICNTITKGRGCLRIAIKERSRCNLGHLTERLLTLSVVDYHGVLVAELTEISKSQSHPDWSIWTCLQHEYCKQKGGKSNNATCANVAKWALESKIVQSNEVEIGNGSKGKFWEKANRLKEMTVLFGRGVVFALEKEITGSVIEKLAMKEGVSGSLKSLKLPEYKTLKAFLDAIWTILRGEVCLIQQTLQAVPRNGIETVQHLLRCFPYSDLDTLSQYLMPHDPQQPEHQQDKFGAVLRGAITAGTQASQGDQHLSISTPYNPMRDQQSIISPLNYIRAPHPPSDASLPGTDDDSTLSTNTSISNILGPSEGIRSTPGAPVSTPLTSPPNSQEADIRSQCHAEMVGPPAGQPLSPLSQESFTLDTASLVRKRKGSPLENSDPLSKRNETDGNVACGRGTFNASQTSQSASLAPPSQASPPRHPQRRGWKKNCPICRCDGLDVDEFKAHMKDVH